MSKAEIVEGLVAGVLTSGVLIRVVSWVVKTKMKEEDKRVIKVCLRDGRCMIYETRDDVEEVDEVQRIVRFLHDIEEANPEDQIKSVSFSLEPSDA
jgi:hypothetical protein